MFFFTLNTQHQFIFRKIFGAFNSYMDRIFTFQNQYSSYYTIIYCSNCNCEYTVVSIIFAAGFYIKIKSYAFL